MWVAKPVQLLSEKDRLSWQSMEKGFPLSQTLCWANAIQAVSGQAYVIFNSEERVGGLLFTSDASSSKGIRYECINGPLLNWDDPSAAPRQLATFAMAATKLRPGFQSLTLRPRWESGLIQKRMRALPIEMFDCTHAATLVVPVLGSEQAQIEALAPRMRRTLNRTLRSPIEASWERATPLSLKTFVPALHEFAIGHSFTTPPLPWFHSLTQLPEKGAPAEPTFWILTAKIKNEDNVKAITQILICFLNKKAYYLFGYEKRSPDLPAALSTSALAHWEALKKCAAAGVQTYDLNGYLVDAAPDHPYYGVSQFKEQFRGNLIQFDIPEFKIE
jgi:hypothetical protein